VRKKKRGDPGGDVRALRLHTSKRDLARGKKVGDADYTLQDRRQFLSGTSGGRGLK